MLKYTRSLSLDICDLNNKLLCNLYDNTSDVDGQATEVFVRTQRNGWKELSFLIPSVCINEEGMEEENYRLRYLIADYRIRLKTEKETDYYIVSEPKITHEKFSKNVSVTAGHVSQLLKNKNLNLEFSDTEGNNVGTAEQLLTTALEGTDWSVGEVAEFLEEGTNEIKVRSITAAANTGAFKIVSSICDKFDAKPVYRGDTKTVDIMPMNPFSDVEGSEIPKEVMEGKNVLEIYYDRNMSKIERTLNTENMITRLYSFGSYGDENGLCSMQTCRHKEYKLIVDSDYPAGTSFYFEDVNHNKFYFKTDKDLAAGTELIWSDMDRLSQSYVWNSDESSIFNVEKQPFGEELTELSYTIEERVNRFEYLMDFRYYEKVGLLTPENKLHLAEFQRDMPAVIEAGTAAATELISHQMSLSEVGESNTGFLRLDVATYEEGTDGSLKLIFDKSTYADGVMYRSDYIEAKRNYFSWYCAENLKDNGDPTSGIGSVVYIIHATDPLTWEKAYVKEIDGEVKINKYGVPGFTDPSNITLWLDRGNVGPAPLEGDRFYLFATNSNSGRLGVRESEVESMMRSLQSTTKIVTEEHPTYFVWDDDPDPSTDDIRNSYGWMYRSSSADMHPGNLYFCYGANGEVAWHRAYIAYDAPEVENGAYFFSMRSRKLHKGVSGQWVWLDDVENKRLATNFSKVTYYCLRHDMLYKGIYDKYLYYVEEDLPAGNYAFWNEFGFYYVFTTTMHIAAGNTIWIDTVRNLLYQTDSIEDVVKPEAKPFDAINFPLEDEFSNTSFYDGALRKDNGIEYSANGYKRSNSIAVHPGSVYEYNVPEGTYAISYNSKSRFVSSINLNQSGLIHLSEDDAYLRFVVPGDIGPDNFLRVNDYTKHLFIDERDYKILDPLTFEEPRVGIMYLLKKFADLADECYLVYLPAYEAAQNEIKRRDNDLKNELGDMYREGRIQANEYVEGDELRLYRDTLKNLDKISHPDTKYNISFLDLYTSNKGVGYSVDDLTEDVEWLDIEITDAVHLVDESIDVNCWAFIDQLNKCYDQPWKTNLQINTDLTLIGQHSFTDVLARIAEVANETSGKQSLYNRAANINANGAFTADKLEGAINVNQTILNGGQSNWYTDPKGNIILESADGSSAMILSGAGWGVATSKDEYGDWEFRYIATGQGMTGDIINGGIIRGVLIEAGSITADKLHASAGQELDIGSNKSLLLYATVDGFRPAGTVQTQVQNEDGSYSPAGEGDSYVQIKAKSGDDPAAINIATGGELNLYGSKVKIESGSTMDLKSGSTMVLRSDADIQLNANSNLHILSGGELLVDTQNFKIVKDSTVAGGYKVSVTGKIVSTEGNIAGFEMKQDGNRKYMYVGTTDSISSTAAGVYLGTDGFNLGGEIRYSVATNALQVSAEYVLVGKQSSGSGSLVALDAQQGKISVLGTADVSIAAGTTINLLSGGSITLASGGAVYIGNQGSLFTVGSNSTNAYIYNGMTSLGDTSHNGIYLGTDGIALGKGVFKVTSAGVLNATSATITGTIVATAGYIGRTNGTGGWYIEPNKITADNGTVCLNASGSYRFYAGNATASNAAFYVKSDGSIKASLGVIGGWLITGTELRSANSSSGVTGMSSVQGTNNTAVAFWTGSSTKESAPFRVTHDGKLWCTNAYIGVNGNGVYITPSSVKISTSGTFELNSTNFSVTTDGHITSKSGTIGGWTIANNTLSANGLTLSATGANVLSSTNFTLSNDGTLTAKQVKTKDGGVIDMTAIAANRFSGDTITGWSTSGHSVSIQTTGGTISFDTAGTVSLSGSWSGKTVTVNAYMDGEYQTTWTGTCSYVDPPDYSQVSGNTVIMYDDDFNGTISVETSTTLYYGSKYCGYYNDYLTIHYQKSSGSGSGGNTGGGNTGGGGSGGGGPGTATQK